MIGTCKIEFLGPILRVLSTICPFRLILQAVLVYGSQTGPSNAIERDLITGSQVPKNGLHRPYEARNKNFNHFPAPRSGSIAQIILPLPFTFFAAIGSIKLCVSATAQNFVLYRRH